jgi:hypothetical protein
VPLPYTRTLEPTDDNPYNKSLKRLQVLSMSVACEGCSAWNWVES